MTITLLARFSNKENSFIIFSHTSVLNSMVLTSLICNLKNSLRFLSEQLLAAIFTSQIQPPTLKFGCGSRCSKNGATESKSNSQSGVVKESLTLVVAGISVWTPMM